MPKEPQAPGPEHPESVAETQSPVSAEDVSRQTESTPPRLNRPLFVYDGDCSFCRFWVTRWKQHLGKYVDFAPYQEVADQFPTIPNERFQHEAQWIDSNGTNHGGAAAVLRALACIPRYRWLWWAYQNVPLFAQTTEFTYRLVAKNRPILMRLTRRLWSDNVRPNEEHDRRA